MIRKIFTEYPRWFAVIWSLVVLLFLYCLFFNQNILIMMAGSIVLYIANGIRAWRKERTLAIVSFVFTVMFMYIFYKFSML